MKKQDYHASIMTNASAGKAFESINSVEKWWTEDMEGNSKKTGDIFTMHFGETFITLKVTELIPGKKVVWYVTDCNKHWLKNKKEWTGTEITWEISAKNNGTQIDFTHKGLVPELECYSACENAWTDYLQNSFLSFVNTGEGQPG